MKRGFVTPSTWTFYADVRSKTGRTLRIEFEVIEDRARISDQELGERIKKTMDWIKQRSIVPAGGVPGRFGVYRGFSSLFSGKWYRHRGVKDYDVKRPYKRGFGGIGSG